MITTGASAEIIKRSLPEVQVLHSHSSCSASFPNQTLICDRQKAKQQQKRLAERLLVTVEIGQLVNIYIESKVPKVGDRNENACCCCLVCCTHDKCSKSSLHGIRMTLELALNCPTFLCAGISHGGNGGKEEVGVS